MNQKHHARLSAQVPASSVSGNPDGNKRQERKDAVSGREDGKQREDTREGDRGHVDHRAIDHRSIDDFSLVEHKGRARSGNIHSNYDEFFLSVLPAQYRNKYTTTRNTCKHRKDEMALL